MTGVFGGKCIIKRVKSQDCEQLGQQISLHCYDLSSAMSWNARPPPYSKSQSTILQQYLMHQSPPASQSSLICPASNQEACMYSNNSNSTPQPLPNIRNYKTPQIPVSNMQSRTIVASQTAIGRVSYANGKVPQQPKHSLQVSSGVLQNLWLNSLTNSMPSHTEATKSHQTDLGTNVPYVHAPQSQLFTSDTCSMQLPVAPTTTRGPVIYQGNQRLAQMLPDQLGDWTQRCTSHELTYPNPRLPSKQYSYPPQGFLQDPNVQKQNFISSTSLQVKNHQHPTYAETLQSEHSAPLSSYQYASETSKRLPLFPYNCRFGSQPVQNIQPVTKHLPVEIPQRPDMLSSEKRQDFLQQNTNESAINIGNFCNLKVSDSVKQPHSIPVSTFVDGGQDLAQNNQEKRMYSCNPSANPIVDTNVTKEKLVRDIKSLVDLKRKITELARKIKINKNLLMAAGCSKTANASYGDQVQHPEFSTKELSANSSNHCNVELLATCLSLWKDQSPKTVEEKISKPSEKRQCGESQINTNAAGSTNPVEDHVKSLCSDGANSQNKIENLSSETVFSLVMPSYESSGLTAAKGTELQIAVVSPLILSDVKSLSGKEVAPEIVYPVIREDSIRSLQNQLAENTAAASLDIAGQDPAVSATATKNSSTALKEDLGKSFQGDPEDTPGSGQGEHLPQDNQALVHSGLSTVEIGPILQIENICSLAEGDVAYNSQMAEIFNSLPLKNAEPQKFCNQQITNSQQKEQGELIVENKDSDFQKNECVQITASPHEMTEQPSSVEFAEAHGEVLEQSSLEHTMEEDRMAKDSGDSAPAAQVPEPQETNGFISTSVYGHAESEVQDEDVPISYLHDQLSELLKEFPYGIEAGTGHEVSADLKKVDQISENQSGDKTASVSGNNTDQIQITILSSEQVKELFPEEDGQPNDIDKLSEPEEKKTVKDAVSPLHSQVLGDSHGTGKLDVEKDKIHCCALGWLSMIYEGVPQCKCKSLENTTSEEEKEDQNSVETNNCKQGKVSSKSGVSVVEINSVPNNQKTPLTSATEKGHFPESHSNKIKAPKKCKSLVVGQESDGQTSPKCDYEDERDLSNVKQDSSLKIRPKITKDGASSKCIKPEPLRGKRKHSLVFHEVSFNSGDTAVSKKASQKTLRKECTQKNSGSEKTHRPPLSATELCRMNDSPVPEKEKLKFKAGASRIKYFEKRKRDHGIITDVEIKKKRDNKQEQNKTSGGALPCNIPANPPQKADVKEKVQTGSKPSHPKSGSSKTPRVITVQEYLQRKRSKELMGNSATKKLCLESVSCDSERLKSSKHSATESLRKLIERQKVSAENSEEPIGVVTSHDNLKPHHSQESRICGFSRSLKGKDKKKQEDKACVHKAKLDKRLASVCNEAGSPQAKEQKRKQYLNRVAFKCTEKESICLTKLDSKSQQHRTDKEKSQESTFMTKDVTKKPSMLEFKLCPDMMLKNASCEQEVPAATPGKEGTPPQVSGIRSTKEDWLKCGSVRTKMTEASQEIESRHNADSRLSKRSFSADGLETLQNPVKDSSTMFRTYKQLYLDKRSRSLGSSPVK